MDENVFLSGSNYKKVSERIQAVNGLGIRHLLAQLTLRELLTLNHFLYVIIIENHENQFKFFLSGLVSRPLSTALVN